MGIYVGPEEITPILTTTIMVNWQQHRVQLPAKEVYVGTGLVWPTGPTYREAFYWFDADTPGRRTWAEAGMWLWEFDRPEWATEFDMVAVRSGGRGFDGARGFGNNDGRGGRAWAIYHSSDSLPLNRTYCEVRMGIPGTTGTEQEDRSPHLSQFRRETQPGSGISVPWNYPDRDTITPSSPTGASVPPATAFGRTWPGGSGGARDQPGQPYGGGGGGGIGGPVVGGQSPRRGQNGAPGYVALRFRSGPVPDGHVWPQNPDWANPQ